MRRWPGTFLGVSASAFFAACGGSEPPPLSPEAPSEQAAPERSRRSGASVSSEIGALDEAAVSATFGECVDAFQRCLQRGAEHVEFLGGTAAFVVKIGSGGRVVHAHLERSTLGDRSTEQCLVGVVRERRWPAPVGGEAGIAKKSFDFDPPDVRPPERWEAERVASTLRGLERAIGGCKNGSAGSFTATLYVGTDGKALGVGVTPPDEHGDEALDCLVGVLSKARWPSSGSWPAKVTFEL